jgi:glycosyltransferase involved in cell wall biosynthesis
MKELLIISPYVPYDKVPHAGGKTHNYYLKRFNKDFSVKLITFANESDKEKIDLSKYGIDYDITYYSSDLFSKVFRGILNLNTKLNSNDKYAGMISSYLKYTVLKKLRNLKNKQYNPELILLEWTTTALLAEEIKAIFPNSKIIASEHDVSFLLYRRRALSNEATSKDKVRYDNIFNTEIKSLEKCDLVLTHNVKDYKLLLDTSKKLKSVDYICPYYENLEGVNFGENTKNLLFFGAMDRPENYNSCIWFIENVFKNLKKIDSEYKFYIVGNKPNEVLQQYNNGTDIIVTGFVDNIKPYFEQSLCMVSSLVMGAGIKVKILEAMSAGLVVLTNSIGIEGIPANNMEHYVHCENPNDYLDAIIDLHDGKINRREISENARKQLRLNFSLSSSYEKIKAKMLNL